MSGRMIDECGSKRIKKIGLRQINENNRRKSVAQVAEKHGWTEPMVWSLAMEGKDDLERLKELNWGLRT